MMKKRTLAGHYINNTPMRYTKLMKLFSWNVNGIRAVISKGEFARFTSIYNPDIICLQETKASRSQVEIDLPEYTEHFYSEIGRAHV